MAAKRCACVVSVILVCMMMTAGAEVWYVDKANTSGIEDGLSWATAFVTLQAGIDAASEGDQVWVKQGVYDEPRSSFPSVPDLPDVDTGSVLMKDGVDLYGGFAGTEASPAERAEDARSIIDGSKSLAGGNAYSVVIAASAILDGFEVTGGARYWGFTRTFAAGLHSAGHSPVVNNCVFRGNSAPHSVVFFHSGGTLRLSACQFLENTLNSAGMYALNAPSVTMEQCFFKDQSESYPLGAAAALGCGEVSVTDCTFENNAEDLTLQGCEDVLVANSHWISSERALFCEGGGIEITACAFTDTREDPQYGHYSTLMNFSHCTAEIRGTQFSDLSCLYLISTSNTDFLFSNCSVQDSNCQYLLSLSHGRARIEDCRFTHNTGDIALSLISDAHLDRILFVDSENNYMPCILSMFGCGAEMDTCLFASRSVLNSHVEAACFQSSQVSVRNSTLISHSPTAAALLAEGGSRLDIVNSIIWSSGAEAIGMNGVSDVHASYSSVRGGWPGTGNMDLDPLFLDAAAGDFRLAWNSPCLDVGDPETPAGFDLLGVPRPQWRGPDMGAYERMLSDGDGDAMDDDWETRNGLDPADGTDGALDLDGDGVSNQDEFWLHTDVNDSNDPPAQLYVAVTGDNASGDGSETAPWATINRTMDFAAAYSAFLPVTIHVGAGDYNEPVFFAPNVALEGAGPSATTIHYLNLADNEHVTVTGAEGATLRNCKVAQPGYVSVSTVLLRIDGVAMNIESVVFDGNDNLYSLGAMISDLGSSESEIRDCVFRRLYNGIQAVNSGVNIVRNQFESIREDAVFVRLPDARKASDPIVTPLLGDASRALTTGNNQFRSVFGSFVFSMSPDTTKAENNDWGIYDRKQIAAKMKGAVDFEPFYGSEDRPAGCRGGADRVNAGDAAVLLLSACALALALRRRTRD